MGRKRAPWYIAAILSATSVLPGCMTMQNSIERRLAKAEGVKESYPTKVYRSADMEYYQGNFLASAWGRVGYVLAILNKTTELGINGLIGLCGSDRESGPVMNVLPGGERFNEAVEMDRGDQNYAKQ